MATSINGGIKFFDGSYNLAVNGATMTCTSGQAASASALDKNPLSYWRSVSSNDTVVETLTVVLPATKAITRILLQDHNWKQYTIKYDVSGVWTDFTSVFGLDGSLSVISETAFIDGASYYEFASVTTGKIQITVTKTQSANQDKYISQIISTTEVGTLQGYPEVKTVNLDRHAREAMTLSGKYSIQKSDEWKAFDLNFVNYASISTYNVDMDVMMSLFDRETPFLVWLCGGRRGSTYFRYTLRGFRLIDIVSMQVISGINVGYSNNVYINGLNAVVKLVEHI